MDLPSGYGRVVRLLVHRFPNARITVCDLMPDAIRFCAGTFNPLGNRHEQAKDHERSDAREEIDCRIPTVPGDLDGAEYQPAQAAPAPGSTKQEANFQLTCRGSSSGTRARGRRCSASTGLSGRTFGARDREDQNGQDQTCRRSAAIAALRGALTVEHDWVIRAERKTDELRAQIDQLRTELADARAAERISGRVALSAQAKLLRAPGGGGGFAGCEAQM
ncbi:MAG: hypothetical protein J2P48_08695 [Alphaproteobacteria bacterium]|nr:hypothetical protein [Alphaproteobacteria bacterium]